MTPHTEDAVGRALASSTLKRLLEGEQSDTQADNSSHASSNREKHTDQSERSFSFAAEFHKACLGNPSLHVFGGIEPFPSIS